MTPSFEDYQEIREYLLGNLSEASQQGIEERLLTENNFLEELLVCEEELIDGYISGGLPEDERLRFENYFLATSERQQKLRFALALSKYSLNSAEKVEAKPANTRPPRWLDTLGWADWVRDLWSGQSLITRAALALALIVVIAIAIWFSLARTSSPRTFATLTLSISNSDRAEGIQAGKVSLPLNVDALRISLRLPEPLRPAARYRVELFSDNGVTKTLEIAGQDAQSVSVVVPARELSRGQYALRLFITGAGSTEEERLPGNYFFTVE